MRLSLARRSWVIRIRKHVLHLGGIVAAQQDHAADERRSGARGSAPQTLASRTIRVTWEIVSPWFAPDGALRDILVEGTSRGDWQTFFEGIEVWGYKTKWTVDGIDAPLPVSADEAFAAGERAAVLLRIDVASVALHCHFFSDDEIELDLDPADVRDRAVFDALLGFLARLGDLVARPLRLTMEGCRDVLILSYSPSTQAFDYHAPPG